MLPLTAFLRPSRRRCASCEDGEVPALEVVEVATPPPTLLDGVPSPAVFTEHAAALRCLRSGLEAARRRGLNFGDAWEPVVWHALLDVPSGERDGWRWALEETRSAWRAAYGAVDRLTAA
jgi:hypothetical protein